MEVKEAGVEAEEAEVIEEIEVVVEGVAEELTETSSRRLQLVRPKLMAKNKWLT